MKRKIGFGILLFALVLSVVACAGIEDNDNQNPIISDVKLNSNSVSLGDTLYLEYKFEDDQYLSTYRVNIDSTFTNTDKTKTLYTKTLTGSFKIDERTSASRKDTIIIPLDMLPLGGTTRLPIVEGDYEIKISCLDRFGNEIDHKEILTLNPAKEED